MTGTSVAAARQQALSLYRRLVRIAAAMPDTHRRRLVAFRAREAYDKTRNLTVDSEEAAVKRLELDILADNLEHQAAHLSRLAASPERVFIPVDIRAPSVDARAGSARRLNRVIDAVTERKATGAALIPDKFMRGPEPSWLRKKNDGSSS